MIAQLVREKTLKGGRLFGFALIIVALVFLLLPTGTVHANGNTYTVTNTNDSGTGSLRQAILNANANTPVRDTVDFSPSLGPGTVITLTGSDLVITDDLDIMGPDGYEMIVSGNNNNRVFTIDEGINVSITRLNINNGIAYEGGGIDVDEGGSLELNYCIVENNTTDGGAYGGTGGGIYIDIGGSLTIDHCIIRNNSTDDGNDEGGYGAGIFCFEAVVSITNSTIHDNHCGDATDDNTQGDAWGGDGGGIASIRSSITLINCTISGNSAGDAMNAAVVGLGGHGGGIYNFQGQVYLNNCTVVENSAGYGAIVDGYGGGIYDMLDTTIFAKNSIIAENYAPGSGHDINGELRSYGCNMIGDRVGLYTLETSYPDDIAILGDIMLGPLGNNGGYTPTHALMPGSPAIDGVASGFCMTIGIGAPGATVTEDQRDIPRPQDGDDDGEALCDIGAYEYVYVPPPPPSQPPPSGDAVGGDVYPVNKVALIVPWIALAAVILAGGIFLIRRRVHSYK
ncbi:choice-of-anchor Q domain-containing protein [Chloroflexota bacterium]